MKQKLILSFLLFSNFMLSQTNPVVHFSSPNLVKGIGQIGNIIYISTDSDFNPEYEVKVNEEGEFECKFSPPLTVGDNIILWAENSKNEISQKVLSKIEQSEVILNTLNEERFSNFSLSGKTISYKATIWNTNFSVPLARFNFTKNDNQKEGDILLFNSIGAGFGISCGELRETRDIGNSIIDQEFVSTFGIHLGFLFSAGTGDDTQNVFAPTLNISVLDFQLGIGYELGTLSENQKPVFLTLSYAIPLYKLKKGGFWIWKDSTPIIDPKDSRLGN
ncbi:hypothetical protein C8N46_105186 [Kordia periserrulae]|uniref:Outer membrane protein with beta-barrel domain n=1 Tax=Kordia periserrulae TaxID=701523 RepID=A0A2T6BY79_9FLAO|nr:hypothetical protein [Kordia periserrulae]PTX61030.1 hypothetical protein C8N46_105186 [Kordia periserrulae]